LQAAGTTATDYVIDLGSGDGKIPIAAARDFGARAIGIEYDPMMVKLARCYVEAEGVGERVEIRQADIFATDFSEATVLTLYLLPDLNIRLRPTILAMRPGTRVVSNTFQMGDWRPDRHIQSELGNTHAYLWIVPARVAGRWKFLAEDGSDRFQLQLTQEFQEVKGELLGSTRTASVRDARLVGAAIEFTLLGRKPGPVTFKGTVQGNEMRVAAERGEHKVKYVGTR
jgi:Methyltransferase domain